MKLPEYTLKEEIIIKTDSMNSSVKFPSGTLVRPFWNETFLPSERRKQLEEALRYSYNDKNMVMCMIGQLWIPLHVSKIRNY
jgi:hypothetical protein